MEMYRLQGATHFIFYNHTVGPDVESILNRYQELGIVSTLTWNLPLNSKKDIRTEAIFTAINDCNMRAAWLFEYLGEYEFGKTRYRESPDSTVFAPPGNRTIEKTVLFGD